MIADDLLESCLQLLQDKTLDEEEQAEKVEDFLREKTSLTGASLENAVLDVLWRHRNRTLPDSSPPPPRHTVIRRSSPAPWQMARSSTPLSPPSNLGTSPGGSSWLQSSRGGYPRAPLSSTVSPFTSPRPSPRLALAQPIPHSPNLNAYEFSDQSQVSDFYGDFGNDSNVDWLVADDAASTTSSVGALSVSGALSATAPEFVPDMSPHDILRTVLGDKRSNEDIEAALEANSYDLGATIAALSQDHDGEAFHQSDDSRVIVGKSMTMEQSKSGTSPGHSRSPVVCKYWLSTGQCLRADCRFSHDLTSHVCKYWVMGNCLAGDGCPFSHDPSALIANLSMGEGNPQVSITGAAFNVENTSEAFPPLQTGGGSGDQWTNHYLGKYSHLSGLMGNKSPQSMQLAPGKRNGYGSRPHSRPTSRHQHRELNPTALSVDDPDAFPTLAAVSAKNAGKKQGKRNNRENSSARENLPTSLADVVRMSPSPAPGKGKSLSKNGREGGKGRENSAAAQAIPAPQNIPWLETGSRANQQYIKYRTEAIRHGTVRNKFLQSAAQAWNRNDARAAKALSLRGQAENEAMRKCHREAARQLYEERNKHLLTAGLDETAEELYVDLHGLHPEEAIEYLEKILLRHAREGRRVIYAITGTGHHSKNGKDKIGKAVKAWLNDWKYLFREFSVPGERGGYVGGILGIDPTSYDKALAKSIEANANKADDDNQPVLTMGKIQLLKREDLESNNQ
ncbi:CCCH zinc finger and SMR domain protein [Aspergillus clavatus NRRL 1]|uniref:CCCH zinc finger and SMR domain protein n=1 Tax=Aspergillus clavatus (strain ATCC 1007 / CBS 513.65 / DSM 816 / NCTC 3887 / NRRL 1 / QM 1276 / 107) TaxID=344612 RepID=A1CIM5_ASPCL|nr:CCCH zinc finger and SMR domain protein [Aspergillus clavatus NRRL 1]EAW10730.1 CCCH zinc finger and SMR domain protein [Aspergillus clavatus NRRL 1]